MDRVENMLPGWRLNQSDDMRFSKLKLNFNYPDQGSIEPFPAEIMIIIGSLPFCEYVVY